MPLESRPKSELSEQTFRSIPGLVWYGQPYGPASGHQALFRFENSYGLSVVYHTGSYGVEAATVLYEEHFTPSDDPHVDYQDHSELSIIEALGDDDLIYPNLTKESFVALAERIRALPNHWTREITVLKIEELER